MNARRIFAPLALLAFAACSGSEPQADEYVARVGDYTLTVDQTVDLLADEEGFGNDAGTVAALAEFWADYTLLAEAAAEDTTFADLDLEPLVQESLWRGMLTALRDSVMQVDTFITPEELEAQYASESPSVQLRARHIMLTYPLQSTEAQRDSVRAFLGGLRDRIEAGESFADLARQFSHDRSNAASGGDLGYFGRGEMMVPFEEAAMALQPGEVSDIVETPLGLHLIQVDDRQVQDFEAIADQYRIDVQIQRYQTAESTFVAGVESRVGPELAEGAADRVRELAESPGIRLTRRAARRPLVEWDGGSLTVANVLEILQVQQPGLRQQLALETDDSRIEAFLMDLSRRQLLIDEARSAGLGPTRQEVDSLVVDAADQLREAAHMLGLIDLDQAPGEPLEIAIARAVEEALDANLSGASQFVPLGLVSFKLRERSTFDLSDAGIGRVIVRVTQLRAGRGLSPLEEAIEDAGADPDSVGE